MASKSNKYSNDTNFTRLQDYIKKTEDHYQYFSDQIMRARDNETFLYVDQWDYKDRASRERNNKPTLQFNKLLPILRSYYGAQRKHNMSLSVEDASTNLVVPQQMIDNLEGITRQILFDSNFDISGNIALKQMTECGWTAMHVRTQYETPSSFNQVIRVDAVPDYQSGFWAPNAQEYDKADGDYAGIYSVMSRLRFDAEYPDFKNAQSILAPNGTYYLPWNDKEIIVVAEIYDKEYEKFTKVLLSDGQGLSEDEAEEYLEIQARAYRADKSLQYRRPKTTIVRKEKATRYKIKHCKFVSNGILEETDYAGQILPIPYCAGDEVTIDGRKMPISYVQDLIDPQKMMNYVISSIAEALLKSRRELMFATPDNVRGYEEVYRNPDNVQGFMPFNPDRETKQGPIVQQPMPFPQQFMQLHEALMNDVQQIAGAYEESRGEESNAQSGVAISQRQESSNNVFNAYQDNLNRLATSVGKIIVDLFPKIYDTEDRTIFARGADNKTRRVVINKKRGYAFNGEDDDSDDLDVQRENDFSKYKFNIRIKVDGSFDEQKQAILQFLMQWGASQPTLAPFFYDIIADSSGLEMAQLLKNRVEQAMPPNIIAQEKGLPPPPPPPPPPPDPAVLVEQSKAQTAKVQQQIDMMKLQLDEKKLQMEAQEKGLGHLANMKKAQAEMVKADTAQQTALIDHATAVTKSHSDMQNNSFKMIQQSEERRAALDEQAKMLKSAGI